MISVIVAVNHQNIMAKNGNIPWYCKEDLKFFKEKTTGKFCFMGRKTYETLKGPLPNRSNIVLTKTHRDSDHKDVFYCDDIEEMIKDIYKTSENPMNEEIFVIGGLSVYNYFFDRDMVDRVYVSVILNQDIEIDESCLFFKFPMEKFKAEFIYPHKTFTSILFGRKLDDSVIIPKI